MTSYSDCCQAELIHCKDCKVLKCECQFHASCITAKRSTPKRGFCKTCWASRSTYKLREKNWARSGIIGFTIADYDRLLKEQDGKCAICEATQLQNFDVDHDHKTGVVRGLICRDCNFMLGKAKDDPIILSRAVEYLLKAGV